MGSVVVSRIIAADPTSTALLLAGPAALDLWPGLRRVGVLDGRQHAEAAGAPLLVRADAPQRTPTAFVIRFDVRGDVLPPTRGSLTLRHTPAAGPTAEAATEAVLEMRCTADRQVPASLSTSAAGFLANLAAVAEQRSHAA